MVLLWSRIPKNIGYTVAHLGRVIDWCRHRDINLWAKLEQWYSNVPLRRAPWFYVSQVGADESPYTVNFLFRMLLYLAIFSYYSQIYPILDIPHFPQGLGGGLFHSLLDSNCFQTTHFLTSNAWPTLSSLVHLGGHFAMEFWKASQLHHFFALWRPPHNISTH